MKRLNGVSYYEQTRKCGKQYCHCVAGEEHGPYWYSRDGGGEIQYIGKELPVDILVGLAVRDDNREVLRIKQNENHAQIEMLLGVNRAVQGYLQGDYLNDHQIRLIEAATGIALSLV